MLKKIALVPKQPPPAGQRVGVAKPSKGSIGRYTVGKLFECDSLPVEYLSVNSNEEGCLVLEIGKFLFLIVP